MLYDNDVRLPQFVCKVNELDFEKINDRVESLLDDYVYGVNEKFPFGWEMYDLGLYADYGEIKSYKLYSTQGVPEAILNDTCDWKISIIDFAKKYIELNEKGQEECLKEAIEYVELEITRKAVSMLGSKIKEARIEANLTQQQLADKIRILRPNLARYEANGRIPTIEMLVIIAKATNKKIGWFLNDL